MIICKFYIIHIDFAKINIHTYIHAHITHIKSTSYFSRIHEELKWLGWKFMRNIKANIVWNNAAEKYLYWGVAVLSCQTGSLHAKPPRDVGFDSLLEDSQLYLWFTFFCYHVKCKYGRPTVFRIISCSLQEIIRNSVGPYSSHKYFNAK